MGILPSPMNSSTYDTSLHPSKGNNDGMTTLTDADLRFVVDSSPSTALLNDFAKSIYNANLT